MNPRIVTRPFEGIDNGDGIVNDKVTMPMAHQSNNLTCMRHVETVDPIVEDLAETISKLKNEIAISIAI